MSSHNLTEHHLQHAADHTPHADPQSQPMPGSGGGLPRPSAREFYGGLAILTVLACVIMIRGGQPQTGMAAGDSTRAETPAAIDDPAGAPPGPKSTRTPRDDSVGAAAGPRFDRE